MDTWFAGAQEIGRANAKQRTWTAGTLDSLIEAINAP